MDFEQTVHEYVEATKQRDLPRVLSLIAVEDDVCLILINGTQINGRAAFINLQAVWFSDPDWKLDYKVLRTIETADMAYALLLVDYRDSSLTDELFNKQHYLSLMFTRKDDTWFLFHDQATAVL